MEKQFVNPATIMAPRGYTHVVSVKGAGRLLYVSGQVAYNKDLQLVGKGDLRAQAHQAYGNLRDALLGAGATLTDVVKINTYVVNYKGSDYRAIGDARREFFGSDNPPASTLVGVTALAVDDILIEVEAIAALP